MNITISGSQFIAAVETSFVRAPLVNSDGYPVPQYVFADEEDSAFFYGTDRAKFIYVAIDCRKGYTRIAPIVAVGGELFGNVSESFEVFTDELKRV